MDIVHFSMHMHVQSAAVEFKKKVVIKIIYEFYYFLQKILKFQIGIQTISQESCKLTKICVHVAL